MIDAATDLFTPTDIVRVTSRLRTCKADECWRWVKGQPVVFVKGRNWRVRTLLRTAFGVKDHEITPCDTEKCQNPWHSSIFAPS